MFRSGGMNRVFIRVKHFTYFSALRSQSKMASVHFMAMATVCYSVQVETVTVLQSSVTSVSLI